MCLSEGNAEGVEVMNTNLLVNGNGSIATLPGMLDDPMLNLTLREALLRSQGYLQGFATAPDFEAKMRLAFGEEVDVTGIKSAWVAGDFSALPSVEVRPSRDINGANGAFSVDTNRIYLAQEFLQQYLSSETESLSATEKSLSLPATAKQSPTPEALETESL
jgi:hypothetical protein